MAFLLCNFVFLSTNISLLFFDWSASDYRCAANSVYMVVLWRESESNKKMTINSPSFSPRYAGVPPHLSAVLLIDICEICHYFSVKDHASPRTASRVCSLSWYPRVMAISPCAQGRSRLLHAPAKFVVGQKARLWQLWILRCPGHSRMSPNADTRGFGRDLVRHSRTLHVFPRKKQAFYLKGAGKVSHLCDRR